MKVTFCLPLQGWKPIGGFKVVYEYANRLAQRGHEVTVVHPALLHELKPLSAAWLRCFAKYLYLGTLGLYRPDKWFRLDRAVKTRWVFTLDAKNLPDADAIVATAWETAPWVYNCSLDKGKKFYLIQHAELWSGTQDQIEQTWQLPLQRIVISKWLETELNQRGLDSRLIYNGLDHEDFYVENDILQRDPLNVCMLYHRQPWKGCDEAIEALQLVQKKHPGLSVTLFGNASPAMHLPEWMCFVKSPSGAPLREIYNQAAIFVNASWGEGWGLTPCEAMQCGCAVAITAVQGHLEYAVHNENALLSPVHNTEGLARNICDLIESAGLRQNLAKEAVLSMHRFDWTKSVDALEQAFLSAQ